MEATHDRIVEAAIELYTELGISATTLKAIGERADVAPGTLRNHFPSRDRLDRAIVERLTAEAPLPRATLLDGMTEVEARLERLLQAAGAFYVQADRLYRMWLRERMVTGPWAEAGARYGEAWGRLMAEAAGPLAADEQAMAIIRGVVRPEFMAAIREDGRSIDGAARLIAEAVAPWLRAREASLGSRPR